MAVKEVWIGTYGPFLYDDEEEYQDDPGTLQEAIRGVNLGDLDDLSISSPTDKDILEYDASGGVFKNIQRDQSEQGAFVKFLLGDLQYDEEGEMLFDLDEQKLKVMLTENE